MRAHRCRRPHGPSSTLAPSAVGRQHKKDDAEALLFLEEEEAEAGSRVGDDGGRRRTSPVEMNSNV